MNTIQNIAIVTAAVFYWIMQTVTIVSALARPF